MLFLFLLIGLFYIFHFCYEAWFICNALPIISFLKTFFHWNIYWLLPFCADLGCLGGCSLDFYIGFLQPGCSVMLCLWSHGCLVLFTQHFSKFPAASEHSQETGTIEKHPANPSLHRTPTRFFSNGEQHETSGQSASIAHIFQYLVLWFALLCLLVPMVTLSLIHSARKNVME